MIHTPTFIVTAPSFAQLRCMQPILLEVPAGDNPGTYPSLVLDFTEGESLSVGVPLERGREVRVGPESTVNVQIARPDGVYVLPSQVVRRVPNGPALLLRWPTRQDRVQRRNHVRVVVMVPVEIWPRSEPGEPAANAERQVRGVSIDLSAGGVRLALPEPLEPERQVAVRVGLPESDPVSTEARVVRTGENASAAPSARYWAALEFVGMLESVRKELTRFVFAVQREQLRNGVG